MTTPTFLQSINAAASPQTQMDENSVTLEAFACYGKNPATSTGLTWGYWGGRWGGNSVATGTFTLTNATDNYIVVARATGVTTASTATTNWNNTADYARVYKVTTAGSVVTTTEDHRAGPYGIFSSPKPDINTTAVGNVGAGEDDLITFSMPAGTFSAAKKGVQIVAWGTAANNANAKTVKLYFGTGVILTTALTANQAGVWRIAAEVFSTGTDAQDYVAQLLQGGATTIVDVENGTLTQDDGAAITIKCTGTATANDDIKQEGLLITYH